MVPVAVARIFRGGVLLALDEENPVLVLGIPNYLLRFQTD
jgi:hypothetical protein